MSAIKHADLVRRLNRRALQAEENARMNAMENEQRPLMISAMIGAALIIALNLMIANLPQDDLQEARPASGVVRVAV